MPELSEAGVAGVMGVMGVSGVAYSEVLPGSAVVVEPPTVWEWKSWGVCPDVPGPAKQIIFLLISSNNVTALDIDNKY